MTLYIGKEYVDRLVARFALSLVPRRRLQFLMSPFVMPVTDADKLLQQSVVTDNVPSTDPLAGGVYVLKTVPEGKRWTLRGVYVVKTGGATITFDGIKVVKPTVGSISIFSQAPAITLLLTPSLAYNYVLDAGMQICVNLAAYTAGDTLAASMSYLEEDAY